MNDSSFAIACMSRIGFQSWSRKMTVSAEVRLRPILVSYTLSLHDAVEDRVLRR